MTKMNNFSQVPYSWYKLIRPCNLSMEDINLLSIINSLSKTNVGCIANDSYFENLLHIPNIRFGIQRLEKANLIQINNTKVRKITVNHQMLDKL